MRKMNINLIGKMHVRKILKLYYFKQIVQYGIMNMSKIRFSTDFKRKG